MNKKTNIFLIVTSIFSMIIILIGATFSYFTVSSMSKVDAISAEAGKLQIGLGVSPVYSGYPLIPLKDELIDKAYSQRCKDDNNNGACLAYTLEVFNFADANEVEGFIDFTIEGIENLSYKVLDEEGNNYLDVSHIDSSKSMGLTLGKPFYLEKGSEQNSYSKKFTLLIWLTDIDEAQDSTDANGKFSAMVTYRTSEGGRLTATVEGMEDNSKGSSVIGG